MEPHPDHPPEERPPLVRPARLVQVPHPDHLPEERLPERRHAVVPVEA